MMEICGNCQEKCVEESTSNNTHQQDTDVISQFVSKESNNRWSNEDAERQDGIHQGDVNVINSYVFHVNRQVWHNCKGSPIEEEKGEFEGKKFHVERRTMKVEFV